MTTKPETRRDGEPKGIVVTPTPTGHGSYFLVQAGGQIIGSLQQTAKGYIPVGCRNPITDIDAAAREVVWKRVQRLTKAAADLAGICDQPVTVNAVPNRGK